MKYKDLPKQETIKKLLLVSFSTPQKNRMNADWCNKVLPSINFLETERIKLIRKYGEENKDTGVLSVKKENLNLFAEMFCKVMETEIDEDLTYPLSLDDFDDDKCEYYEDKKMWLNGSELNSIIKFIK